MHVHRGTSTDELADGLADLLADPLADPFAEEVVASVRVAFYALAASNRPPRETPVVRFEGLPGEFSQHDFGEVDVRFRNGQRSRIHFFASRLKYSRHAQVTIVEDERVEPHDTAVLLVADDGEFAKVLVECDENP